MEFLAPLKGLPIDEIVVNRLRLEFQQQNVFSLSYNIIIEVMSNYFCHILWIEES